MSSDSAKLDSILARLDKLDSVEAKIDNLTTQFNSLSSSVKKVETTVATHTEDIAFLKAEIDLIKKESATHQLEVKKLKTSHNAREQRLRAGTLRIFNLPVVIGESLENYKSLTTRVYDRILRPALTAAKTAGDAGSVPQIQTAVEACFRAFSQREPPASGTPSAGSSSSTPPPVIVRLSSTAIKWAVMKHRRSIAMPPEGERTAGVRRYIVVEDLTPDAHHLLKLLQADDRTDKVWSTNGLIFFSRPGVTGTNKVKNIYDPIDTILG